MARTATKREKSLATSIFLVSLVALVAAAPVSSQAATSATGAWHTTASSSSAWSEPAALAIAPSYLETRDRVPGKLGAARDQLSSELSRYLQQGYEQSCGEKVAGSLDAPGRGAALQSFPEWRPGGSITQLTTEGSYPRWFSHVAAEKAQTIQGRYWMNRALLESEGQFTARQVAKMRAGFAPQARVQVMVKRTGQMEIRTVSKELHHNLGSRGVPGFDEPLHLRELWPWEHSRIDPSRRLDYEFLGFVD